MKIGRYRQLLAAVAAAAEIAKRWSTIRMISGAGCASFRPRSALPTFSATIVTGDEGVFVAVAAAGTAAAAAVGSVDGDDALVR